MSSDPWAQAVNAFFNVFVRRARLLPDNKVSIEGYNNDMYIWVRETLDKWKNVKTVGIELYQFENKKEAEKFITLFNLKWAR
jgi:hypothetical protein